MRMKMNALRYSSCTPAADKFILKNVTMIHQAAPRKHRAKTFPSAHCNRNQPHTRPISAFAKGDVVPLYTLRMTHGGAEQSASGIRRPRHRVRVIVAQFIEDQAPEYAVDVGGDWEVLLVLQRASIVQAPDLTFCEGDVPANETLST